MATSFPDLTIERIKSERNKDKATTHGYIYTLNRVVNGIEYWVCENRITLDSGINTIKTGFLCICCKFRGDFCLCNKIFMRLMFHATNFPCDQFSGDEFSANPTSIVFIFSFIVRLLYKSIL